MLAQIAAYAGVLAASYFGGILLLDSGRRFDPGLYTAERLGKISRKRIIFVRIFAFGMLAINGILVTPFVADLRYSLGIIWFVVAATAGLAYIVPGPIEITRDGLLRKNNFRRDMLIRWDELDHYEIRKGPQGGAYPCAYDLYYFRASDGRTIKVNDWTQDAHDLLSNIRQHKSLPEHPFNPH